MIRQGQPSPEIPREGGPLYEWYVEILMAGPDRRYAAGRLWIGGHEWPSFTELVRATVARMDMLSTQRVDSSVTETFEAGVGSTDGCRARFVVSSKRSGFGLRTTVSASLIIPSSGTYTYPLHLSRSEMHLVESLVLAAPATARSLEERLRSTNTPR